MGLIDRFGSALSSAGSAIQRVGSAIRGASTTTIAPTVNLPGVPHWPHSSGANQNGALREAVRSLEAYYGRVSYDAGPSWTRFSSYPATDLTPEKISGAQQEAVAGYPLRWTEMIEQVLSRDSHLSGIAQQRVEDVIKGSWRLVRSRNDDVAACVRSFCEESLRAVEGFEDGIGWLLFSNAYGYNALETTWKWDRVTFPGPDGKVIGPVDVVVPARVDPVHPKHFRFDLRTDEPLLWLGSDQISLPFGKFIFVKGEGHHPITERRGYMWPCVWLSMFRSLGWAGWAVYVERFGLPTPLIKYDGTVEQYAEHKSLWEQMLQWLGRGYGAIVPKGTEVEFAKAEGRGRSADPHSAISDACDAAQSVRVLGATLTAKIGNVGSFSATAGHLEVKYAKEEADTRRLWSANRSDLMTPLVLFNAEELARAIAQAGYSATPDMVTRRVPRGLHRVPREIDPIQRGQLFGMAINEWGLPVGKEASYDEFNLPQPIDQNDVLTGKPQPVTKGGKVVGSVEASNEGADAPEYEPNPESGTDNVSATGASAD
jgi:hypothetical protein